MKPPNDPPIPVEQLSKRGLQAAGQPIGQLMADALNHPHLISLAAGFVDSATLPVDATRDLIAELFQDGELARTALQYGTTHGYLPLREEILAHIRRQDAALNSYSDISVDQILLTAGSNQLLQLLVDTICDPGDIVIVARPSYFVFLGTLSNLGVRAIGANADEQGLNPRSVEQVLQQLEAQGDLPRVRAIYCVSDFDNPRGVSTAAPRRAQLVDLARRWSSGQQIWLLEDAAYRDLRYEGDDIPSIRANDQAGDTVILTGTFSKSFSPGLRVGWGLIPANLVGPLIAQKGNADFGSPHFAQSVMHAALASGHWQRHVATLQKAYRVKRDAMLRAADDYFEDLAGTEWTRPEGGLYVWLSLPEHVDTGPNSPLWKAATDAGVLYVPGQYAYPADGTMSTNAMRLSFGVQTPERIDAGMKALADAVRRQLTA